MRAALLLAFAAVLLLAVFWDGPGVRHPPGVLVPFEPDQELVSAPRKWPYNGAEVTSLANFRVRAQVLLRERYWHGMEAAVSPLDLTLGWRLMSNQEILDGLHLYRMRRAYSWSGRNGKLPAAPQAISANSANMHMVPSTPEIEENLRALRPGDLIDIRGYLVEIRFPDGEVWRSSLSRDDVGNGACELVWVTDLTKS